MACFGVCAGLCAQTNSYIDSTRPTISSDAAIQQRGVLQIESGYDGYFHSYDQTAATSFYYAATNWLRLDASLSVLRSTDSGSGRRTTGVGSSSFGAKAVLFHDGRSKTIPGFALAYSEALATATEPGIQSRSHQGTVIISNTEGPWRWKVNGSVIGSDCYERIGCSVHGQGAVGVSYSLSKPTTLAGEFFGETTSAGAPPGAFLFAGLSHNINERLNVNGGLRFGVTTAAPAVGLTFGVTFGVGRAPIPRK